MSQYCRYCSHMCCGDANYCGVKKATFSDEYICRTNKCKDFELNPIDALGTGRTYTPREKGRTRNNQITFNLLFKK